MSTRGNGANAQWRGLLAVGLVGFFVGAAACGSAFGIWIKLSDAKADPPVENKRLSQASFEIIERFMEAGAYREAGQLLANALALYPEDARLEESWNSISRRFDETLAAKAAAGAMSPAQYASIASLLGKNSASLDRLAAKMSSLDARREPYTPLDSLLGQTEVLPDIEFAKSSVSVDEADKLYAAGKYSQAYDMYYALCGKSPNDVRSLIGAGKSLFARPEGETPSQKAKIVSFLERAVKLAPTNREARFLLKDVYYGMGDFVKARDCLMDALKIQETDFAYWISAGDISIQAADYGMADDCYVKASECRPGAAEAYAARADLALRSGKNEKALELFRQAISRDSRNERAAAGVAIALRTTGDLLAAAKAYESAHAAFGRIEYAVKSAEFYLGCGMYDDTIRLASASISRNQGVTKPDREMAAAAYLVWARALVAQGKKASEILAVARKGLKADERKEELIAIFSDNAMSSTTAKEAYGYLEGVRAGERRDGIADCLARLMSKYPEARQR